jgi:dihydropteroate synthase
VAEQAIQAGARIINDVWGFRADPELANVAAKYKTPVILMHNRSNPASLEVRERLGGAYIGAEYIDLVENVKSELMESVTIAKKAGVEDALIILDPGIGFGKTREHNLQLINRFGVSCFTWPIQKIIYRLYARSSPRSTRGRHRCRGFGRYYARRGYRPRS